MKRSCGRTRIGLGGGIFLLHGFIECRGGCPCAMTIDQRGKQAAIDVSWNGNVIGLRQKVTDGFLTVPVAFDLVSVLVEPAAPVTVGKDIGIVILERFG